MVSPKAPWGNKRRYHLGLWERIEPVILEEDPPKARGRKRSDPRQIQRHHLPAAQRVPMPRAERAWGRWHHSSHLSTVGRDGRLAPNVGSPGGRGAKSWMAWTGNGRRQTEPWARHVLGGPDWAQPYGPWQGWYQAQSPCGWRGRPLEHCGCGSKRARCQAVGGDPGRRCGRTTTAHRGGTPTPVSGQRV